jgi:uncharacterized protein (DUF302 family)
LRIIINIFAAIGLISIAFGSFMIWQGSNFSNKLDPKATQVFEEFTRRALKEGVASANIIKLPVDAGIKRSDVIESMKLRANKRNIKFIRSLRFDREITQLTDKAYPYVEIFLFCDALTASKLLDFNHDFVAYMPCSISLFEDAEKNLWLVTMNLDMLIYGGEVMDQSLKESVLNVKTGLLDIMAAGATGSL